jgi:hypothetical protein
MLLIGLNRKGKTPLKKLILHGRGMKEPASQAGLALWTNAKIILFLSITALSFRKIGSYENFELSATGFNFFERRRPT